MPHTANLPNLAPLTTPAHSESGMCQKFSQNGLRLLTIVLGSFFSAYGCATSTAVHAPRNYLPENEIYPRAELRAISTKYDEPGDLAEIFNRRRCAEPLLSSTRRKQIVTLESAILSIGDILRISVTDGDDFSGEMEIGPNGRIDIPYLSSIAAAGQAPDQLEDEIAHRLVREDFYKRGFAVVTVERLATGPRRVSVSGAVFQPGGFVLNTRSPETVRPIEETAIGDSAAVTWFVKISPVVQPPPYGPVFDRASGYFHSRISSFKSGAKTYSEE